MSFLTELIQADSVTSLKTLIIFSPFLTALLAIWVFKKQNSSKAWTGGPISKPKSHWLAWTVFNWFFVPFFYLLHSELPHELTWFFVFHLLSWWARGPLELIMIYKWFNWTPYYGIAHDIFHFIVALILLLSMGKFPINAQDPFTLASYLFAFLILATTLFEASFAYLFLKARSQQEEKENIYFASDDPKWIFINRVTLTCVLVSYSTGLVISGVLLYDHFN
jgi:hypothetical protein